MKVRFWGVRGSIPTPGKDTAIHGGNTSCYEIEDNEGRCIIFDAGTGIRELGNSLMARQVKEIHLFISHTHWDHIQGFPFFVPTYVPGTKIFVYGPTHFEKTLANIMTLQMDYAYFPISAQQLQAEIVYRDLQETSIELGSTKITTKYTNHPVTGLCYKVESGGKSVVYSGDFEPYYNVLTNGEEIDDDDDLNFTEDDEDMDELVAERNAFHQDFCRSDLLIHDSQYTSEEYHSKFRGWGHTWMEWVLEMAKGKNIGQTILSHHDPSRKDTDFIAIEKRLREQFPEVCFQFSKEGDEIEL